jgi:ribosomal protein S18 acetylase RimI-like enzyme
MDLRLRAVSPEDLARYIVRGTEEYVGELVRSGMPEADARINAEEGIGAAFPDGVPANDNEMFDVLDGEQAVGHLWLGPLSPGTWYVMDIEIREEFRRRGYGRVVMLLAEDVARAHGAQYLGLNVFGHNPTARALYESLGYETQSVRMRKPL